METTFLQNEEVMFTQAFGLSEVFKAYAENCDKWLIEKVTFNNENGSVQIHLGNRPIIIESIGGQQAQFVVTELETNEQGVCYNFEQAVEMSYILNTPNNV